MYNVKKLLKLYNNPSVVPVAEAELQREVDPMMRRSCLLLIISLISSPFHTFE
jgi:hypothetical protein